MFEFASRYFWAAAIVMTAVNVAILKVRSTRYIQEDPERAEGYAVLFRGYLIWMSLPWVVMGIGCTFGGVRTVWRYLRPQDGDPYVLAWFASVFAVWIVVTCWLLFRGGAEMLIRHPGVLNVKTSNPTVVKLFWFVCLAGGVAGVIIMWTLNIPLPSTP